MIDGKQQTTYLALGWVVFMILLSLTAYVNG